MTTDKNYSPPAPFGPFLGISGPYNEETSEYPSEPVIGMWVYEGIVFHISDEVQPALPLKMVGNTKLINWEVPKQQVKDTQYAIDANNQCWKRKVDGVGLFPVSAETLLLDTDEEKICASLGVEPPELDWQKKAKAAGWISPEDVFKMLIDAGAVT